MLAAHDESRGCVEADGAELRALGFRLLSGDIQERLVYVEFLARAERCEPEDRAALELALARFRTPSAGGPSLPYAPLLNAHIVGAELDHGAPPSPQAELIASRGGDAAVQARNRAWGAPPLEASLESSAAARVVLFSGRLDPLDPPEWAARTAERWGGERVIVESAGHSVLRYMRTEDGNCGHAMLDALLADPRAPLDRSCLADVEPIDWAHARPETAEVLGRWFGD